MVSEMPTIANELEPKQVKALECLMAGGTQIEAGEAAGVSREMIRRWLKLPAFREALREAKADSLEAVRMALVAAGSTAVDTLIDIATNSGSDSARGRAANDILSNMLRIYEVLTVEERLLVLESRMESLEREVPE